MRRRPPLSVKALLAGSLALLCTFLAVATGYILYELTLRKHDYQILNLAGQMRVLASSLDHQAAEFLAQDGAGGDAFMRGVQADMALYQRIILGFAARELPADLIGHDEALRCNWDQQSTNQLDRSVGLWNHYRDGFETARGDGVAVMATYLAVNGPGLIHSTEELANAFQSMMEGKLRLIQGLIMAMLGGAFAMAVMILVMLRRFVLAPLAGAVAGFGRVASGDLGFQVQPAGTVELGQMTTAFNQLSSRLLSMFELIDRVGRGSDLSETLAFVAQEFNRHVPVDGLALLITTPDGGRFVAESAKGLAQDWPVLADPALAEAVAARQPRAASQDDSGDLADQLKARGAASALLLPLPSMREGRALLLVLSCRREAYTPEHQRFLGSIAVQLDGILSRTMVMDGLVVAAVQGLAKLAESRDPETGDHLVRMSLYSAFIAEDLAANQTFADEIDGDYIRALHRFAPMHDIGKVGIADRVLLKPGRLDDDERAEMNRHPIIGAEVLKLCETRMNELGRSVFRIGVEITLSHHEKWDGSGYPHGLAGAAIPLSARIVAVADVFDALTSKRPYKDAWSVDKALAVIQTDAGSHFDPQVVQSLLRCLPRIMEVYERLKHV